MIRLIPFDYSTHFLESLRSAYLVLQRGKGLCFFPEGLRSITGEVGKFKKGFGVLAKESGALLVPVAIEGAYEAWPSKAKYPHPYPIRVRFGKPLLVEDLEKEGLAMGAQNSYAAICLAGRKALMELKDKR
jgi:long-chain acyl-CoA synthetase